MKRLLVCLLLVGVVGCGESEPNKEISDADKAIVDAYCSRGYSYYQLGQSDKAIAEYRSDSNTT